MRLAVGLALLAIAAFALNLSFLVYAIAIGFLGFYAIRRMSKNWVDGISAQRI
ncbi:MAG: hypothetical protein R3C03_12720 [Pirellulaceae bacterium]